ncbi:MAG: acetate--CoA ligase [Acidimicrobiia bacterium]
MAHAPITKSARDLRVAPNLADYADARASFTWSGARAALDGLPGGGANIAHECVDRHAAGPRADRVALRWIGRGGETLDLTYADLRRSSSRFASVLSGLGVERADRVFVLTGRIPALYDAVLGTLRHGGVACTLFAAFGPEPICQRVAIGGGRVLVTTPRLYRQRVAPIRHRLPDLEHVLLVGLGDDAPPDGALDLDALVAAADDDVAVAPTRPDDPALLHFTSGTTGTPKGAVHVHEAVLAHLVTGRLALDLHDDDVFWCTADPGWVTGVSYGIVSPLANGVRSVVDEGEFDPERWFRILAENDVTVWYTAPTAVRMMMRLGIDAARAHALPALRFIASVGEPLNPEAVRWGIDAFGLPIHDNWWQTETGGIMVANYAATEIRPGSMGRPIPGIDVAILRRDARGVVVGTDGEPEIVDTPMTEGELAIRRGWPSMFREYLGEPDRYAKCFVGDWYCSGDLAMLDADGYVWFVGRADDIIKSAGHLIGPFEVESALMEHPAVAEAGVFGKPDPIAGELVKAMVLLRPGFEPTEALRLELIGFGRKRLGAAIAPKELDFASSLPKTRSGKIMRRVLRARELGLPVGDLSTLEPEGNGGTEP